jgi:hypothetical protein
MEATMAARKQSSYQIISTRMHGMVDIGMVLLLIATPFVLGFANLGAAQFSMQGIAAILLIASMLTRYEFGLLGIIPMPMHLVLDIGAGVLLMASPWIFGFAGSVFWPHVVLGLAEAGAAAVTKTQPQRASMLV